MILKSNLAGVLARTQRLRDRDIPEATARTLAPERWVPLAYERASKTLYALAKHDQMSYVAGFLRTLQGLGTPEGFALTMASPFPPAPTVADYQAARGALKPEDLSSNLFLKDVSRFQDYVREWVETEKRLSPRESPEQTADFISYALLAPDGGGLTVREGPNKGRLVRDVFLPHITAFIAAQHAATRLDGATIEKWLLAVLAAWRAMVHELCIKFFRAELKALRAELPLTA